MILFYARKRYATCSSDDRLTTGSVGVEVVFHFSDDWTAAPARIAVFRGSGQSVDVALLEDRCTVPPEVLTQPGSTLTIGVYGTDGARTVVIPTVYAEAGQIKRGTEPSGVEPTPETQPLIDQLLAAAKAARDAAGAAERLAKSVKDAADAGEFDGATGADGSGVWYTTARVSAGSGNPFVGRRDLIGREGATVQVHDLLVAPDVGDEGEPTTLYEITSVKIACTLKRLCKMKGTDGEDGTSPSVIITEIEGGHRITITDEAHPEGQSFDVMDGSGGGGGTSDYSDLSNKPSIEGVTLAGNKTAADLGLAKASDIPAVPVQSVNNKTGAVVLNASDVGAGTYSKPSGGIPKSDLASAVQSSLSKADTALQSAPVTSVNGQTGAVTVTVPTKTSDLTNDSGFVNAAGASAAAPVSSVNGQTGAVVLSIPTVPSNVSSFTNDAGYLTLATLPVYNGGVT